MAKENFQVGDEVEIIREHNRKVTITKKGKLLKRFTYYRVSPNRKDNPVYFNGAFKKIEKM